MGWFFAICIATALVLFLAWAIKKANGDDYGKVEMKSRSQNDYYILTPSKPKAEDSKNVSANKPVISNKVPSSETPDCFPKSDADNAEEPTFTTRLDALDPSIKDKYNKIKNYLLSFGLWCRATKYGESFRFQGKRYTFIRVAGKGLQLYLAISPYSDCAVKYKVKVATDNKHSDVKSYISIKSDLSVKHAFILVDKMMDIFRIQRISNWKSPEEIAREKSIAISRLAYRVSQVSIKKSNWINIESKIRNIGGVDYFLFDKYALVGGYSGSDKAVTISDIVTIDGVDLPVTGILENAFKGNGNLKEIIIPNSIEMIGDSAFSGCYQLKEVYFPDSVKYVGNKAFESCLSLNNVSLSNDAVLGNSTFEMCNKCNVTRR